MVDVNKIKEFYLEDYQEMLFPMETCRFIIEKSPDLLSNFIKDIETPLSRSIVFCRKRVCVHQKQSSIFDVQKNLIQ
jgi:hypothetical protein